MPKRSAGQVLVNKRSREDAEKTRLNIKSKLTGKMDITAAWPNLWTAAAKT